MKDKQFKYHQTGVTLMELIASLAIMAVIVAGAVALYSSATSSERAASIERDLLAIQASTRALFLGQGSYGPANSDLNNVLIKAKKIPSTIKVTPPNTLTHQAHGNIAVKSTGSSFAIELDNISEELCISLMTRATQWASVQAGTQTAQTSFPVSPAVAATQCAANTDKKMRFVN